MNTITDLQRGEKVDQQDFSASLDERGQWQATFSFKCWSEDVVQLTPLKGATCPKDGFSLLTALSATVTQEKGSAFSLVTVLYTGTTADGSASGSEEGIFPTYSLDHVSNDEPIESHPDFKELTDQDWLDVSDFKKGLITSKVEGEEKTWKRKLFNKTTQKYTDEEEWTAGSPEVTQLIGYLDQGITHFKDPQATWTMEYISSVPLSGSDLDKVGKIDNPKGSPPPFYDQRDWILHGATMNSNGDAWTITLEWLLSGRGGWNPGIYN